MQKYTIILLEEREKFCNEPDFPLDFGYKSSCLAFQSTNTAAVIEALKCSELSVSNWKDGFDYINKNLDFVFITPEIRGWWFVISHDMIVSYDTIIRKFY